MGYRFGHRHGHERKGLAVFAAGGPPVDLQLQAMNAEHVTLNASAVISECLRCGMDRAFWVKNGGTADWPCGGHWAALRRPL
jgi:hypothetical protein